jgi:60kDa lysophospholipase
LDENRTRYQGFQFKLSSQNNFKSLFNFQQSYEFFDGFVVLHGTDTLSYTASALSFMLENLGKTVIITGSQIPIFETRTDGKDNFMSALIIAGN